MPQNVVNNFKNKLGWLYNREFCISPCIDWKKLEEIGIMARLAPYLTKTFIGDRFSFTCNWWRNLFGITELVYKELCVEFFASVSFEEIMEDPYFEKALVFRLGGEYRECSLTEFSWRMGIY